MGIFLPLSSSIVVFDKSSKEAAEQIPDKSLALVFLNNYATVLEDLAIWYPKLKLGGIMSGRFKDLNNRDNAALFEESLNTPVLQFSRAVCRQAKRLLISNCFSIMKFTQGVVAAVSVVAIIVVCIYAPVEGKPRQNAVATSAPTPKKEVATIPEVSLAYSRYCANFAPQEPLPCVNHRNNIPLLLERLNITGEGAEIGVQSGVYSKVILEAWKKCTKFYAVLSLSTYVSARKKKNFLAISHHLAANLKGVTTYHLLMDEYKRRCQSFTPVFIAYLCTL
ncbi:hypothetical protein Pelo_2085 [Pelomyxa schiedti]|nr:hypothetical protein Pelo_2085 [Pelomyxa schiedti]